MSKKLNIIESTMKYPQVVIAFVVIMMIMGAFGLKNMPRREFPEFTIRQGVIVGLYPGASSKEVEQQLTTEVENYLFGYEEVNKSKTYSHSNEGLMIIYVELNDDVHDADKFWSKLRHGLDELKMQLPAGVIALVGNNDFGDTSALLITMSSEKRDYHQLEEQIKRLEADIRKIHSVSKIKRYGTQQEKVYVYIDNNKLNEYHINPTTILSVFKMQKSLNYAGKLDNGKFILPIHTNSPLNTIEDVENQIVYSDPQGNIIRIKDIATVERKYSKPDNYLKNNGNNALLLSLEMHKGNNIVQFGKEVQSVIAEFKANSPADLNINVISNLPEVVDKSISHFLKEFIIAIIAVILVTMVLLPFRVASVAGVTIPISVLMTIGIMQMIGIQLHIVSLAGLIVVLGMVVDNAIVVIDNYLDKIDSHEKPWDAAYGAAKELFIPILSATVAIIAAFFPLMLFLTGISGDFVGTFPLTIGIALIISLLVAILLVPFMCYTFIKTGLHKSGNNKKSVLDRVQYWFDKGLDITFHYPKVTIFMGIIIVTIGILTLTGIEQKLFPAMERSQFPVEIYLPEGASLKQTAKVVDTLEKILLQDNRVTNIASFVGMSSPRFNALYAPHVPSKNYGQLMVNTISDEATIAILDEYSQKYSDFLPNAHIKWKQLAMEQFDAPLEIRVSGNNTADIKAVADSVSHILKANNNITWVRTDWGEMRPGISVDINKSKANRLGYTKSMVSSSLMTSLEGIPLTTLWEGNYPVNVILTQKDKKHSNITDLENEYIKSLLTTQSLPLRSIAQLHPEWTQGTIVHRNGVPTITVKADIKRQIIASTVFKLVEPTISKLHLPEGVIINYGGDNEATAENMKPLVISLLVSIIIIFLILLIQFKTIRRALLIMSAMLFSIPGASLGLKLTGYPFGLTSFVGLIGLMGIVVRNGIILVDYAMHLVKEKGYDYREAAITAGKRRMRPIFLTAMAAAMGVVPMIISGSPLWGPLGAVICFGMIVGMVVTLFVLPVLYWKSASR